MMSRSNSSGTRSGLDRDQIRAALRGEPTGLPPGLDPDLDTIARLREENGLADENEHLRARNSDLMAVPIDWAEEVDLLQRAVESQMDKGTEAFDRLWDAAVELDRLVPPTDDPDQGTQHDQDTRKERLKAKPNVQQQPNDVRSLTTKYVPLRSPFSTSVGS
jgi:hypothetical protein